MAEAEVGVLDQEPGRKRNMTDRARLMGAIACGAGRDDLDLFFKEARADPIDRMTVPIAMILPDTAGRCL